MCKCITKVFSGQTLQRLNPTRLAKLCSAYSLGDPIGTAQEVAGYMATNQILTVVALQQAGHSVLSLDDQQFMVMPWIEGVTLPVNQVDINNFEPRLMH